MIKPRSPIARIGAMRRTGGRAMMVQRGLRAEPNQPASHRTCLPSRIKASPVSPASTFQENSSNPIPTPQQQLFPLSSKEGIWYCLSSIRPVRSPPRGGTPVVLQRRACWASGQTGLLENPGLGAAVGPEPQVQSPARSAPQTHAAPASMLRLLWLLPVLSCPPR